MKKISWEFPLLGSGPVQGYTNNDIEAFKGEELMDNLAREICQNSLDAHDPEAEPYVKVVFELKKVKSNEYDVFTGYKKCLNGCRSFWADNMDSKLKKFLDGADATLAQPEINILVAGDYNTKGLSGSRTRELKSAWLSLTSAEGVSAQKTDVSGGSYGIGKNAPFACSSLSMVFYNTYALDGEKAFVGVAKLATLLNDEKGKRTQRVGRYENNDTEDPEACEPIFDTDENSFRDLFLREEKGTDVIIAGFNEAEDWETQIIKAVIKNFFVAIQEEKLIVELKTSKGTKRIDINTIAEHLKEMVEKHPDKKLLETQQLYAAFTSEESCHEFLTIADEENAVELFIRADKDYSRKIANFRDTGMMVGEYSMRIFQHYAAVLIVRGPKLSAILRDTEPPRHNRWDHKLISKSEPEKRKRAKECIEEINAKLREILKKQFEVGIKEKDDPSWLGEYLADEENMPMSEGATGQDILKPIIKVGEVKKTKPKEPEMPARGKVGEGKEIPGDYGNKTRHPDPDETEVKPRVKSGGGDSVGVKEGAGAKVITVKELPQRRAFPLNAAFGLYRIVLAPKKDYSKLFVQCYAAGEDGDTTILNITSFKSNGKNVPFKNGKAGPIQLSAGIASSFEVMFEEKDEMALNLILSEGE